MVRSDLHAIFRSNDRGLQAVEVFTNRENEWNSVMDSIRAVQANVDTLDVDDIETPRRNVLVFYGVGGIGKTTLSHQIAQRLTHPQLESASWQPPNPPLPLAITVSVDFSRQRGTDMETFILQLRTAVTSLGPMPAFDLAFRRYWDHHHPGERLEDYLRSHATLRRFAGVVPAQIESGLEDIAQELGLPGLVGGLVGKALVAVVRAVRSQRLKSQAWRCRRLPDLLEADPDIETLSYYPHLLAWDLAHVPERRQRLLVVLLDTFEDVGSRGDRERERLIQRTVWLMPNALFIVTGRNRLDWDDSRLEGRLDWSGPRAWPLLAPGADSDPTQHLVGYLSASDCEGYLSRRLVRDQQPLIPAATRALITTRSEGLPLFLDLAVLRFLSLYGQTGTLPVMTEFDHDFTALASRIFRDLTPDERTVLRAVSLLDSFSVELATAAAGLPSHGPAISLVDRPFVEYDPDGIWPSRLHNLLRTAIRAGDRGSDDSWSAQDWRNCALRAFNAFGSQWQQSTGYTERRTRLGCLLQGVHLAREFDLELAWLMDAAFDYVDDSVSEPLSLGAASQEYTESQATVFAETLTVVTQRNRIHRRQTVDRLQAILDSRRLPDDFVEFPLYYLAMCERDLGQVASSMIGMRRIVDSGGRLAADAARGLLHLSRRLGKFRDALAAAESLGRRGKQHRAIGEIWWSQANIPVACASLASAYEEAVHHALGGEAAMCQTVLAFAAAFEDRARAAAQIARAVELLSDAQLGWTNFMLDVAHLLRDAGYDNEVPARAESVATAALNAGLTSPAAYARFAACFHAAVVGSPIAMNAARSRLQTSVHQVEFAYLVEISYMMSGSATPRDFPRADWIEGEPTARTRWQQLVIDRRHELAEEGIR